MRQERGWKFFLLLPLPLFRLARVGFISKKKKLEKRFVDFAQGEWLSLLEASRRWRPPDVDDEGEDRTILRRAGRAHTFVQLGEPSSASQALEGADLAPDLAPGNNNTLGELRRRPARPHELMQLRSRPFDLDEKVLGKNLRSAKRGAAGGPSGMTTEHLRPLLDTHLDMQLLHEVCQQLARAEVAQSIINGKMTALSKSNGGVRGIVAVDVLRRLTARTMAQQLGKVVEAATAIPVRTLNQSWM